MVLFFNQTHSFEGLTGRGDRGQGQISQTHTGNQRGDRCHSRTALTSLTALVFGWLVFEAMSQAAEASSELSLQPA